MSSEATTENYVASVVLCNMQPENKYPPVLNRQVRSLPGRQDQCPPKRLGSVENFSCHFSHSQSSTDLNSSELHSSHSSFKFDSLVCQVHCRGWTLESFFRPEEYGADKLTGHSLMITDAFGCYCRVASSFATWLLKCSMNASGKNTEI